LLTVDRHDKWMRNFKRRAANERRESASNYYKLFKTAVDPYVKRKAGLRYLKLMSEVRELEKS